MDFFNMSIDNNDLKEIENNYDKRCNNTLMILSTPEERGNTLKEISKRLNNN